MQKPIAELSPFERLDKGLPDVPVTRVQDGRAVLVTEIVRIPMGSECKEVSAFERLHRGMEKLSNL